MNTYTSEELQSDPNLRKEYCPVNPYRLPEVEIMTFPKRDRLIREASTESQMIDALYKIARAGNMMSDLDHELWDKLSRMRQPKS